MIKIRKASAGSGKTHLLSQTYLDLLRERYAYRHILAVTFTNKATAEMKERILRDLKKRSESDEDARIMLSDILHDYSAFSVSTIDKFFQRAIKAFAREIGQMSDYQVELDRDGLIAESMDRVQEQLTLNDTEVLLWLKNYMKSRLLSGDIIDTDNQLFDMGKRLKNAGIDDPSEFNRARLKKVRENCDKIIHEFHDDVWNAAKECVSERRFKKEECYDYIKPYLERKKDSGRIGRPDQSTLVNDPGAKDFIELLYGRRFEWYNTAVIIRKSLFSLGLAAEFLRCFNEILDERGIMCLDESNVLLEKIIAGSEAPFVYEKMGVRYTNFLLDEFQDTSNIQWNNFRPLLGESEANGNENLIVGDVKQSIYRWRDSDWELLAHRVKEEFPDADEDSLDFNWRSLPVIREFNNGFFSAARTVLSDPSLYKDVVQKEPDRKKDPQEGFVKVTFCHKEDEMNEVFASVNNALEAGASLGDIIILVRDNAEGSNLAKFLLENGISVISEEFLTIASSPVVGRLVALLASHDDNQDEISKFIAQEQDIEFPEEYHSLMDLCEQLLRELKRLDKEGKDFEGQTLYVNAFLDCVKDWSDSKGEDLHDFLAYWEDKKEKLSICTPDNKNSIRIMTIHKAKGLEAPYVIFPYMEKVKLYKAGPHWCKLETEGTPFCPEAAGMYPVQLDSFAENSLFKPYFDDEKRKQLADNLNVIYVAFTRASKCMHVISADVPGGFIKNNPGPSGSYNYDYKSFSQILYQYCSLGPGGKPGGFSREYGKMYDFTLASGDRKAAGPEPEAFAGEFCSYDFSKRLRGSKEAAEFFAELDSSEESARQVGTNLHAILEKVEFASDLERAVSDAVQEGLVSEDEGKEAYGMLKDAIASKPEFFPENAEIRNEMDIFDKNGEAMRPDRVIIEDGCVTIVDYKFGERHASYPAQVRAYMQLYRDMGEGYREVRGFLWYVKTGEVEQVTG